MPENEKRKESINKGERERERERADNDKHARQESKINRREKK
jgi:hypothetical protein